MSHHYSGPNFGFPHGDARLDLTDIYAFGKPGAPGKSVLVMNVHPSSSVVPVAPTTREPFAPTGLYELMIDTNGDAVADMAFRMRVSSGADGQQNVELTRQAPSLPEDRGQVIFKDAPVSIGKEARVSSADGFRLFAGWRSDPFFFDTLGALDGLRFTGHDFFTDKDVCSFVIELPDEVLGGAIGLWGRTLDGQGGTYIQVERGAHPQQAVFLPGEHQPDYMAAQPADDTRFVAIFAHALEHAGGYSPAQAQQVARSLLPDVMPYDPSKPTSFPDNGRHLTDDAASRFIALLTNGRITSVKLGRHTDLLDEFPYLGPPHHA